MEHRYGAVLLGYLLTGDPVPGLGDNATPISVHFQASAVSPVDDLLVIGRTEDGDDRRLTIGVRRAPAIVTSAAASSHLVASYLKVVTDDWLDVQSGRWRLGLAVSSPNAGVRQVGELAGIARGVSGEEEFRAEVARRGRTNQGVRDRLVHLDALVDAAVSQALIEGVPPDELTWRLLSALQVTELRLEGTDQTDRSAAVARLRPVTSAGTAAAADELFARLTDLAGRYAPEGADVTEALLRRDLFGTRLARSPLWTTGWSFLDGLAERLRDRIGFRLTDTRSELELQRTAAREALASELFTAGNHAGALVVFGEPDVGKSSLTLRAAESISTGAAVTSLSLRDLPVTMVELEAALGGPLTNVLGGVAVEPARLLVIDGAEAVLEGRAQLFRELATTALRLGIGVVAVTRADGKGSVIEALKAAAGTAPAVREHEVPPLTSVETGEVASTFTSLSRLGGEPRDEWLLGRLGLVDLLLRAGASVDLPEGPLSEADLLAAIWYRLVRRGEEVSAPGGPSPDSRERALTSVARRLLVPEQPLEAVEALASLRSDGLLLRRQATSPWSNVVEFGSDLVRDLALAWLLFTEGWEILDDAGAPRWALRATRLACQARLLKASADVEVVRLELQRSFADLASRHGERWGEVPFEALLTLGDARAALRAAWPALLAEDRVGLRTLLRLALQRYSNLGIGDSVILAPLVETCFSGDDLVQDHRFPRGGTGEQIRELILAWLRGLVMTNAGPDTLRQQLRSRLLGNAPNRHDEFAVEALAMLGPDLDANSEAFLRDIAKTGPAFLAPAVESIGPIIAMSSHQVELLLVLSEAYYIEQPARDDFGWSSLDDGIRHHHQAVGFGMPMVAWYFGPFFRLLNSRPLDALSFINRMLNHAAALRVQQLSQLAYSPPDPQDRRVGLQLDLPGVGPRQCVGDSHVWSWYRGSSVGPYPCMSALLAVERFADYLVDDLKLPVANVAQLLLRDCQNLAMPGLVVGLLVRHLEQAGDLLDGWLKRPELWHLEFSRTVSEGLLHVQGSDGNDLVGRNRRTSNFRDVASEMTIRAMLSADEPRLAVLENIGAELLRSARDQLGETDDGDELAGVRGWEAVFHRENYRAIEADDGRIAIQFDPPDDIALALAPSLATLTRTNQALRLQMTYGTIEDRIGPVDTLPDDLALARELSDHPPANGPLDAVDPVAAVGAVAILAVADRRAEVPSDELLWAAKVLIRAARRPVLDEMSYEGSMYQLGADRSAAVALPALLMPIFDLELDHAALEEGLRSCATSLFDEVRAAFVNGAARVWPAPCGPIRPSGPCRHEILWEAAQQGLRDCRLGDWDQGHRRPDPLDGPYESTLPNVETESLRLNRLVPPLVAAAGAVRSGNCVATAARPLLAALLDAHRRTSDHWATQGYGEYGVFHNSRLSVPRVLAEFAALGESGPLVDHVRAFATNARALGHFLRELALVFTYDQELRGALPRVWREVMQTALDAIDDGADLFAEHHWSESAIAGLIPTPQLDMGDTDADATLIRAQKDWVEPDEIADLVTRWLPLAQREPRSVEAVARLGRCTSREWQATTGLTWAEEAINGQYASVAGTCWFLADWLEDVRASSELNSANAARWRRIVDGLAGEGDERAVKLQQAEE